MITFRKCTSKNILQIVSSLLLILFSATIAAANMPTDKLLDGADIVNVQIKKHYTINPDGSSKLHIYIKRRILTYKGKKDYADCKFTYNHSRQQIKLIKAQTKTAQGKIITVKAEEIHDIPAPWNSSASLYSQTRQMVVSMPAVEPGSEIEIEVELKNEKGFWCEEYFRLSDPILDKLVIIDIPASIKLRINFPHNLQLMQQKLSLNNETTTRYQWQIKNIPASPSVRGAAPLLEQGFCLLVTSFSSWRQIADMFKQPFNSSLQMDKNDSFRLKTDHNPSETPNSGTDKTSYQLYRKIRALTTYDIDFQETDWQVQNPAETRRLGYGTDFDLALYLSDQLIRHKLPAEIILVNSQDHFLRKFARFPYPGWWDTAMVKSGDNFFLFSSTKPAPGITGYNERLGLNLTTGKLIEIKDDAIEETESCLNLDLSKLPAGVAEFKLALKGSAATSGRVQWRDLSAPEREIASSRFMHNIDPEAQIIGKLSISGLKDDSRDLVFICRFKTDSICGKLPRNQFLLPLEAPELPYSLTSLLSDRKQPLVIYDSMVMSDQINVLFPKNCKIISMPSDNHGQSAHFFWQTESKFDKLDNSLSYKRKITLKRGITVGQSPEYRTLLSDIRKLYRPESLRIIFSLTNEN